MAFKLDKKQRAVKQIHIDALRSAAEGVKTALRIYNDAVNEAAGFVTEIAEEQRSNYDDKSEKWQESDAAQSADEFISEWEGFDGDEADEPTIDHHERLDSLPDEAQ